MNQTTQLCLFSSKNVNLTVISPALQPRNLKNGVLRLISYLVSSIKSFIDLEESGQELKQLLSISQSEKFSDLLGKYIGLSLSETRVSMLDDRVNFLGLSEPVKRHLLNLDEKQ